jgi:hypothetical protein
LNNMEGPHGAVAASATVLLVDLPVRLWDHARQHGAALVREFAFIEADGRHDTRLARRLLEIAATSGASEGALGEGRSSD